MVKITSLSEKEIKDIGEAFADNAYADGEKGMTFFYNSRDAVRDYICGYVRTMIAAGFLYSTSEKHEAFIAFRYSKDKMSLSSGIILLKALLGTMGFGGALRMLKLIGKGGESYEAAVKKSKQPYIFVGLVAVRKEFQGQGYMRKVLDIAFEEDRKRECPVILETDAVLKRDKYVHLGMENVRTRKLDDCSYLYDLVKR